MEEYALIKDDQLITLECSLDIIKAVISYREKVEVKKVSTESDGEQWQIYANGKYTHRSYCADSDPRRGYTLEEMQKDFNAKELAKMFNYKIYQRL
jgi:hypothetical protein